MRPRFFNRGEIAAHKAVRVELNASMRPRFFNRGEQPPHPDAVGDRRASMRPRFFNRGEPRTTRLSSSLVSGFNEAAVLQPRRVVQRMETAEREPASMRPRFFNRGEVETHEGPPPAVAASMRPRFFNRGELKTTMVSAPPFGKLQ